MLLPMVAIADAVEINGIYYTLSTTDNTAWVASNPNMYTGSIVIPESVTYENVTYSVTSIGQYAFSGCSGLTSITIGNNVTSIGDVAFQKCSGLISVTIPNSVTSIGSSAFYNCTGLTSVTIGNSVTSIGSCAFYECTGLTSITIGNSVTSIGHDAFSCCSSISNINIPVIDFAAFCNNKIVKLIRNAIGTSPKISLIDSEGKEIQEYIIPDGVTSVGQHAFYGCSGLTSIEIPNSVTNIGDNAFYDCSGLTSIEIPNSVTSIGDNAFYDCSGLTSIEIPNSVTSIGDNAFYGSGWFNTQNDGILYLCNWLLGYKGNKPTGDLKIVNGTKCIRSNALYECSGLTSIEIPNSVTSIGNSAFSSCSGLIFVTIGNSVTIIGSYAFSSCKSLTSIEIPNSVTSIGNNAFVNCNHLNSVTLSKNLNSIGERAFYNCGRLSTINCLNPIPPSTNGDTFICLVNDNNVRDKNEIYNYAILNVPRGSKEAYSAAAEWRYFKNIREMGEGDSEQVSYVNLTIQLGTTGFTRQSVKTSESYTFYIGSYGDNRVNAVTFNGEDVTNRLTNGYYTTPVIIGASILSVTYETTASAIQAMKQSNLKVIGYHGEINISDIESTSDVTVYTVDGKLVDSIPSAIDSVRLQVPSNQLYIVRVANRTFKLAM